MPIRIQLQEAYRQPDALHRGPSVKRPSTAPKPSGRFLVLLAKLREVHTRAAQINLATGEEQWLHQQRCVLAALRDFFEDSRWASVHRSSNWLERLHGNVLTLVPPVLLGRYPVGCELSDAAVSTIQAYSVLEDTRPMVDSGELPRFLSPYRHRGNLVVCKALLEYHALVVGVIEHLVGYAIPTEDALHVIARHAAQCGVVECGAGTGYWAAMLKARGVDVLAFDVQPPEASQSNPFFGEVHRGDARDRSFFERADATRRPLSARALLLVWPNNPDRWDNPHVAPRSSPTTPCWDAACAEGYLAAGGRRIIYVGEREAVVAAQLPSGAPADCGISSSRRFQRLLSERLELVQQVSLPSWWAHADDLTVWTRREDSAIWPGST